MDEERHFLTKTEARALLNGAEKIHVFFDAGVALIGADWDRWQIEKLLEKADTLEIGGPACVRMGHGLVAVYGGKSHFIESNAGLGKETTA